LIALLLDAVHLQPIDHVSYTVKGNGFGLWRPCPLSCAVNEIDVVDGRIVNAYVALDPRPVNEIVHPVEAPEQGDLPHPRTYERRILFLKTRICTLMSA